MNYRSRFIGFCFLLVSCCIYIFQNERVFPLENNCAIAIESRVQRAKNVCENLLDNITDGKWVRKIEFLLENTEEYRKLLKEESDFDSHMNEFRIKRGIHTRLWRDDGKCGIKNLQAKPPGNHWGGVVGGWCDAKSAKPCCSHGHDGTCGQVCDCKSCIDMQKIYHAEFSKWIPSDARCMWKNYTAESACDAVRRFSGIHFVGDSFVRKMGRGFILLMKSDTTYGAMAKLYNEQMSNLCVGVNQFYWTECRYENGTFAELLRENKTFCGMDLNKFSIRNYPNNNYAAKALAVVKSLAGKVGSVLLLGVGGHMNCKFDVTVNNYVGPIVDYIDKYYEGRNENGSMKWPHIIFMYSDTPDVLKSPSYRPQNGKIPCYKFADIMGKYCKEKGISVLDFRKLTSGVHSYDGTHHGLGVNVVKNQLLLNYLDSIEEI